jgi:hypothetical protein
MAAHYRFETTWFQHGTTRLHRWAARDNATAAKLAVTMARLGCTDVTVRRFDPAVGWQPAGSVRALGGRPVEQVVYLYDDVRTAEQRAVDGARTVVADTGITALGRRSGMRVFGAACRLAAGRAAL